MDNQKKEKNKQNLIFAIILILVAIIGVFYLVQLQNKPYYVVGGRDLTIKETIEIFSEVHNSYFQQIVEQAKKDLAKKNDTTAFGGFAIVILIIVAIFNLLSYYFPKKGESVKSNE